jgi:hypothetical protein
MRERAIKRRKKNKMRKNNGMGIRKSRQYMMGGFRKGREDIFATFRRGINLRKMQLRKE